MKILFGASGHAKVIAEILQKRGESICKIVDDAPKCEQIFGVPVKHSDDIECSEYEMIIAIGNNEIRQKIAQQYSCRYATAIHPSATVSEYAVVGNGTVVMANAVINPDARIGEHCIINTGAVVEHDCNIAAFVHISPNASLAGNVEVGEGTHIGIGASVIQGIKIGKWAVVGAGAVVIRDVPDYATVVGNPARIIKIKE